MQLKKRDDNLVPVLVAIVALISLALWYNYLGDYTIKKVDAALGVNNELKITDLVIEKGYSETPGLSSPEIKISYETSKPTESYIEVNDVVSNKIVGQKFSKTIILNRDFFGKTVEVRIYAKDAEGERAQLSRNITLPTNLEPVIAIINT
jgi:hypothetical protein